jgi:hypothetical protein
VSASALALADGSVCTRSLRVGFASRCRIVLVASAGMLAVACLLVLVAAVPLAASPAGVVVAVGESGGMIISGGRATPLRGASSADWSAPLRLLAVAAREHLVVVDRRAQRRWSRNEQGLVGAPRWSSVKPYRLAYLVNRSLRIVNARGGHGRPVGGALPVAAAWRPHDPRGVLAYVDRGDVVRLVEAATGTRLASFRPPRAVVGLSWSGDGNVLVVNMRFRLATLDANLHPLWQLRLRHAALITARGAPSGSQIALLLVGYRTKPARAEELRLADATHSGLGRLLARGNDLLGPPIWSPDARTLLISRFRAHRWLYLPTEPGTHPTSRASPSTASGALRPVVWAR